MGIPIEIQKIKDPNGVAQYKALVTLQQALTDSSLSNKLLITEEKYADFIKKCLSQLKHIYKNRKNRGNSLLKWKLADTIYRFLKSIEKDGFVLANITEALSRDLGISRRQINYLIEFRTTYPTIDSIHEKISWDKYKELLDIPNPTIRKECEEKILKNELPTRESIREFKKRLKFKKM